MGTSSTIAPRPRPVAVLAGALVVLLAVAVPSHPAAAAPVETPNACLYSYDQYFRNLPLTFDLGAAPEDVPAGSTLTVTGRLQGRMPEWIPVYGYNYGILQRGSNAIPTRLWVALEGTGTTEGTQVVELTVDATTTVDDPDGAPNGDESGTPPVLDVELPPTTWTAAGGPIEVRQAGDGALADAGVDAAVAPEGSVFIAADLGALQFELDCRPGEYTEDGEAYAPLPAPTLVAALSSGAAEVPADATTTTTEPGPTTTTGAPVDATSDGDGGSALPVIVVVAVVVVAGGGVAALLVRRRRTTTP